MYFICLEHEENYDILMKYFKNEHKDYIRACYVAAIPKIFKHIDFTEPLNGPFDWYFKKENSNLVYSLYDGEGTNNLVDLGLHFWSGDNPFNLNNASYAWRNNCDYFKVLQQICVI
ncbi:DUF2538 family protein [Gottfriedia acidiceleris]|uniref:DUF2538 family protein n=1 Tax=Bacillaceae TaxID=186817 RepID=UPI000BECB42C|nr:MULTISPECIES: DUF2538 family protein [unclassified Bacillus (in: firmicutes)]PEC50249.1 hypothetical protein CON00_07190 [Bacillus sp. AFS096315]PFM77794.1 hypothetical protein COJ46_18110 [Bacillus sp. AFS077874]